CNGRPMKTATAAESLATTGVTVASTFSIAPQSIYVDDKDNLYVADDKTTVFKWTPAAPPNSRTAVAGGNGAGSAANQLNGVSSIYVDGQDNLFIADAAINHRIQEWPPNARAGTTVINFPNSGELGHFYFYFDCDGNIYSVDILNLAIDEWTPGTGTPSIVARLGAPPPGYVRENISMGKDAAGNLFVAAEDSNNVIKWAPGASTGVVVAGGNGRGAAGDQFNSPLDIKVDGDDTLYIADTENNRVQKWGPGATAGVTVVDGSGLNPPQSQALGVSAICRDKHGSIYVADPKNLQVEKFTMTSLIDSSLSASIPGRYWAVVTDMRGYTHTTDTILVNTPQAGAPSITVTATATNTPVCVPITFTADTTNAGAAPSFQWEVSGVRVGDGSLQYSNNLFADGDHVYCIMTTQDGCLAGTANDTSNSITLAIDPQGTASVTITAAPPVVCKGDSITFMTQVTNGSAHPTFQWLLNGNPIPGDDSASWHSDSLVTGDVIFCRIISDDVCGLAKSNSIPVVINTPPFIPPGQVFTIAHGKSLTLDPVVNGDIASWRWTPSAGLSDSSIADPVADPASNTLYTLKVTTPAGCSDSAAILVNIYTPLGIPNAFTPNGDGHNDIFYVLGGPYGSRIEDLAIYDRWGQKVFHVHDTSPGDPTTGWNGAVNGRPAPTGTYLYLVVLRTADGLRHQYNGTVVLIR
ncbi:MAG TPA: gliding motility-associated C-terminal domain-containing protein, partial [Puia sp.]|nr:gliding motility-associated C-terminal domain-containing protein [Puia sp.]